VFSAPVMGIRVAMRQSSARSNKKMELSWRKALPNIAESGDSQLSYTGQGKRRVKILETAKR
jgi:hypothetical protein